MLFYDNFRLMMLLLQGLVYTLLVGRENDSNDGY